MCMRKVLGEATIVAKANINLQPKNNPTYNTLYLTGNIFLN